MDGPPFFLVRSRHLNLVRCVKKRNSVQHESSPFTTEYMIEPNESRQAEWINELMNESDKQVNTCMDEYMN